VCENAKKTKKRPDLWKKNSWILHHDNAPVHTSLFVHEFLSKNNTVTIPQLHIFQTPYDFFLFTKIKKTFKGSRFTTIDDIKSASLKEFIKVILKIEFEKCFED